jgi:hypothetical protein
MSSYLAHIEVCPNVPNTPNNIDEIREEVILLDNKLGVEANLSAFRVSFNAISTKTSQEADYYLLMLDIANRRVSYKSYKKTELNKAQSDYLTFERSIIGGNSNAVLVQAESIEKLRIAYPNYYLDTNIFIEKLRELTLKK